MDIGQRVLEAVQRSESTGIIVDNYQGLSVYVRQNFLRKEVDFAYRGEVIGVNFRGDEPIGFVLLAVDMCLRNLGFNEDPTDLGEL